jgi:hypothetical protein
MAAREEQRDEMIYEAARLHANPPLCPVHETPLTVVHFCARCRGKAGGAAGSREAKQKAAKARWKAARKSPETPRATKRRSPGSP